MTIMGQEDEIEEAARLIARDMFRSDLQFDPSRLAREILAPRIATVAELRGFIADLQAARDEWHARVKVLLVENADLREALEQCVDDFGDSFCVCPDTKEQAIRALTAALREGDQ